MRVIAIIPARYDSSRFKGSPLADLCGRPMLWWVYHQVKKARKLQEVWVATDHEAIRETCAQYRIPCRMTSHPAPHQYPAGVWGDCPGAGSGRACLRQRG